MKILVGGLIVISIFLLDGCGEKNVAVEKTVVTTAKELTPEEKFLDTKRKAEQGDVNSQFSLAEMYMHGKGVAKDDAKAKEWIQKAAPQTQIAAEQGNAIAQYFLGIMYGAGIGVLKDYSKAVEWYQKAAEQGLAKAQSSLGSMYSKGEGVSKDYAKAAEWYQKAAAQGYAYAQLFLGMMYSDGEGVPKDYAKAVELYQKAAVQGIDFAQYKLAQMYELGKGVPKDAAKAVEWYQKAAAQGYDSAQDKLSEMYESGIGVSKNRVLAYAWFNLAAAQQYRIDFLDAEKRNFFESRLSPSQRSEAERLSSNWKKGDILQAATTEGDSSTQQNSKISKQGTGTAFLVSREGHALTNYHVVNTCKEIHIAGRNGIVNLVTSDSMNDLALLQVPVKNADMALMNPDPSKLRQGEDVIVFGYPFNSVLSSGGNLTPGTLSALTGLGNNTNGIQITAPIQAGSSGSPVLDKKGNVIGVVSMKLNDSVAARATGQIPQNVNFAVNGQTTKAFLEANKVPYKTGGGFFSREKSNADIAEEAKKWTVIVECWR